MKRVGAGLDRCIDNAAGAPPIFNVIVASLQLEFCERIYSRLNSLCALILQVGREGIVVCTIQHKVILRGAVSVDAENALGTLLERRARLIHACGEKPLKHTRKQCVHQLPVEACRHHAHAGCGALNGSVNRCGQTHEPVMDELK